MATPDFVDFHFDCEYDERLAFEARCRGHLGGVTVQLSDGTRHRVFFYDAVRLAQELEDEAAHGRPFVAERGMIVLTEITIANMRSAVAYLAQHGFFGSE